ncbi:roadblock/LC7 domain-containing protein [Kineosporia succinea]|uniref:Regulator of Ras-like GTPase activity (Roadblock/LC7/MglB family) n=1 Tax=Kineosporia succinea TaxID=84632 RepID=A0ABT9P2R7_9ACTN|nr:roadblock/LC7 domain-containing protein [Kineosporia succinea]MDP9826978.1 putative regulator of Ras-like GTPase activity (Roadblock/LC7/MglB family) [Kineosporia succinea]
MSPNGYGATAVLSPAAQNVSWMLDNFVRETAGVEQIIGVSSDGLLMAMSVRMDRGDADKLGATVSGLTTLSQSASHLLNKGGLTQVIIELSGGYLLCSMINGRACLGVVTSHQCDLGLVGYETAMLVERVGALLTPELITELKANLAR